MNTFMIFIFLPNQCCFCRLLKLFGSFESEVSKYNIVNLYVSTVHSTGELCLVETKGDAKIKRKIIVDPGQYQL